MRVLTVWLSHNTWQIRHIHWSTAYEYSLFFDCTVREIVSWFCALLAPSWRNDKFGLACLSCLANCDKHMTWCYAWLSWEVTQQVDTRQLTQLWYCICDANDLVEAPRIQLLLNIFGLCGRRHGLQFDWSTNSERKIFRLIKWRRSWSSFDVNVFSRCSRTPLVRLLLPRTWHRTF